MAQPFTTHGTYLVLECVDVNVAKTELEPMSDAKVVNLDVDTLSASRR